MLQRNCIHIEEDGDENPSWNTQKTLLLKHKFQDLKRSYCLLSQLGLLGVYINRGRTQLFPIKHLLKHA